mgnify:CR=1 FL=1
MFEQEEEWRMLAFLVGFRRKLCAPHQDKATAATSFPFGRRYNFVTFFLDFSAMKRNDLRNENDVGHGQILYGRAGFALSLRRERMAAGRFVRARFPDP